MEVVPDYEDRGMKKWRPFYSSPELRLSLNSVMNESGAASDDSRRN